MIQTETESIELIKRILTSNEFRSSTRLCELLNYVADASERDAADDVTEQQIGQRVFGRKPGYNCSEDSIVRSEMRQLRLKLTSYFLNEGCKEPTVVEIPKGRYLLTFRARSPKQEIIVEQESPSSSHVSEAIQPADVAAADPKSYRPSRVRTAVLCLIATVLVVIFFVMRGQLTSSSKSTEILWQPFLSGSEPVVVFSNTLFEVSSDGRMQPMPVGRGAVPQRQIDATPSSFDDSYTGVGEVASVHALDRLFVSHGKDFLLRRNYLLNWEEVRENNLIVLGSTAQNTSIKDFPMTTEFSFDSNGQPAQWGVVNKHPVPGEKPFYTGNDKIPAAEDYAIIALLHGPTDRHWMLWLGGCGTYGTQAAGEYAMSERGAAKLLQLLGWPDKPRPFEAVLRVDLVGGVPLNPEVIAFRKR